MAPTWSLIMKSLPAELLTPAEKAKVCYHVVVLETVAAAKLQEAAQLLGCKDRYHSAWDPSSDEKQAIASLFKLVLTQGRDRTKDATVASTTGAATALNGEGTSDAKRERVSVGKLGRIQAQIEEVEDIISVGAAKQFQKLTVNGVILLTELSENGSAITRM